MTLIISTATSSFVLQVTDRLVSRPTHETFVPVDERANKSIIFLASDGVVALGCTGPAFIQGVPADLWLARRLSGDDTLQDDGRGAIQEQFEPKPHWLTTGQALGLLKQALQDQIESLRDRYGLPTFEVVAAGWQWRRSGQTPRWQTARPVIVRVHNGGGSPRRFLIESSLSREFVSSVPSQLAQLVRPRHLTPAAEKELLRRSARINSIDELDEVMQAALVAAASKHAGIGRAAMSIVIPAPQSSREVHARFLPDPSLVKEPGYTPWLVTPRQTVAPSLINARFQFDSNPFTFIFDGGRELIVRDDGAIVLFESQSRPRFADGIVTPSGASRMLGGAPLSEPHPESPPLARRESPRKARRNEPCPCGSGRKYKKCHGAGDGPTDWVRVFRAEIQLGGGDSPHSSGAS